MTWQIVHNFDVEGGKVNLNFRCPYLEMQMWVDPEADTPENLQVNKLLIWYPVVHGCYVLGTVHNQAHVQPNHSSFRK